MPRMKPFFAAPDGCVHVSACMCRSSALSSFRLNAARRCYTAHVRKIRSSRRRDESDEGKQKVARDNAFLYLRTVTRKRAVKNMAF